MTKDQKIQAIRGVCALYECRRLYPMIESFDSDFLEAFAKENIFNLVHVFQAMPVEKPMGIDEEGTFLRWQDGAFHFVEDIPQWNLHETLDNQSEETIDFIHSLLTNDQ